jgi:hypothetical protein
LKLRFYDDDDDNDQDDGDGDVIIFDDEKHVMN